MTSTSSKLGNKVKVVYRDTLDDVCKVDYKTIQQIDFTSAKTKKRKLDTALKTGDTPALLKRRKLPDVTAPTSQELGDLYSNIHKLKSKGKKTAILSLLPSYAEEYRPASLNKKYPLVLSELFDDNYANADEEQLNLRCEQVFDDLCITEEEAKNCEMDTRSQANCKQWFRLRAGRITASRMKAACRTPLDKPSLSLVKDICYPVSRSFLNTATQWGCQHEERARNQYRKEMEGLHENFVLRDNGLVVNPKYPFLGASPDAMASCNCCGEIVVEIKCPYCQREKSVSDDVDCLEEKDGQLHLKRCHAYFYQVQCQLLLTNTECCDFVVWTERDFFTERIVLYEIFCEEMVMRASLLFKYAILGELVGKLYSKPKLLKLNSNKNETQTSSDIIICTCRSVYREGDANVIGSDSESCPYQWLHFTCAKIKKIPNGKWYCKECKKKMKSK